MKQSLKTLLAIVPVVAAFLLLSGLYGGFSVKLDFGEDALLIAAPKKYSVSVNYDEIKCVETIEVPDDAGTIVSGDENRRYSWGERKNDTWGNYILCISREIETAVMITTINNEVVLFNHESSETTIAIAQMFNDLLTSRKNTENSI